MDKNYPAKALSKVTLDDLETEFMDLEVEYHMAVHELTKEYERGRELINRARAMAARSERGE